MKRLISRMTHDRKVKEIVAKEVLQDPKTQAAIGHFKINNILSDDDIRGEFNVGLADGLNKVKAGIGDPFSYLRMKGIWAVRHAVRKELKRKIVQKCKCGRVVSVQRGSICPKCGTKAETETRFSELDETFQFSDKSPRLDEQVHVHLFVDTLQGRKKQICELILNGVDGDSYLKAIAEKLSCTPVAVAIHVRKIRQLWAKYNNLENDVNIDKKETER